MNPNSQDNSPFENAPQEMSRSKLTPLALVLVSLVSILIGGGAVYYLTQAAPRMKEKTVEMVVASVTPVPQFFLTINSPSENSVAYDDEILVAGKTMVGSMVSIFSGTDETIVETDENGGFESTVTLGEGTQSLIVTAFGANGEEESVTMEVSPSI